MSTAAAAIPQPEQPATPEEALRAATLDVIRTSSSPDPGVLAGEVLDRIPPSAYRGALHLLLRTYVRQTIHSLRSGSAGSAAEAPGGALLGRSWKREGAREAWRIQRLHVGGSEWKFLPTCTYDDLMSAAAERRELADANAREAAKYEALAALVQQHGTTVDDAPADEVVAILNGDAA